MPPPWKNKSAFSAPYGMAGNNLQRLGTHTPTKALPSATLRSAPVRTFDGTITQGLDTA